MTDDDDLDAMLELQLAVAWAGEADTSPPRLGWWRTSMCDEYGGEDLLRRLAPRTWAWATLETCRAAARRVDDRARSSADDADHLLTLFRLGAEIDARLDERLRELKLAGGRPEEVLSGIGELIPNDRSVSRFEDWIRSRGEDSEVTVTPLGRRLRGAVPTDPVEVATRLACACLPVAVRYPLPHYRTAR